jgi:hypothetical protein
MAGDEDFSVETVCPSSLRVAGYREVVSPISEDQASSFDLSHMPSRFAVPGGEEGVGREGGAAGTGRGSRAGSGAQRSLEASLSPAVKSLVLGDSSPTSSSALSGGSTASPPSGEESGRPIRPEPIRASKGGSDGQQDCMPPGNNLNPGVKEFNPAAADFTPGSEHGAASSVRGGGRPPAAQGGMSSGGPPHLAPAGRGGHYGPGRGGFNNAGGQGAAKMGGRLPVFSSLQSMDSGSERGSSRRSDRSSPTNSIDSMTNSIDSMHTDGTVPPRMLIRDLTQKMGSKDESKAAAAAKKVFDIVRESCPTWRQNQTEICRSKEMLSMLARLLRAGSERCRYEACRALGNIAFQNPGALGQALPADLMSASGAADALSTDICFTIVSSHGMMDGLKYVLRAGTCNSKHEAARVINNCAAYSPAAAELIVNSDGVVEALKGLCGQGGRAQRTRAKAVGAFNCLSTYECVRPTLLKQKVVEEALLPALAQRKKTFGDGDEFKAMRADAVMAAANLVGKQEFSVLVTEPDAFKTVTKCLKYGIEGQVWAGVTWTAYSALLPLSKLTVSDCNKAILHELGIVGLLIRVVTECLNKIEVVLGIECLDNMLFHAESRADMVKSNLGAMLLKVARIHLKDSDEEAHRQIQRLIWVVSARGESCDLRQMQHQHAHPSHGRHIFISYCPELMPHDGVASGEGYEERIPEKVRLIKESLQGAGFRVWCNGPGGDIDEMAEAVSCSSIFVMCATKAYKENCETRLEGSYAEEARRAIIVCAIESDIDRNFGWIAQLAQGRQGIDFLGEATQDSPSITRLVNIALQWLGPPRQLPPPASPRNEHRPVGQSSSPQLRSSSQDGRPNSSPNAKASSAIPGGSRPGSAGRESGAWA